MTISDYYFNLYQIDRGQKAKVRAQNLDRRIYASYKKRIGKRKAVENLSEIEVRWVEDVNGLMTVVSDLFLLSILDRQPTTSLSTQLAQDFDITFLQAFQKSKFWL